MPRSLLTVAVTLLLFATSAFLALQLRETSVEPPAGATGRLTAQSHGAAGQGAASVWALDTVGGTAAAGASLVGVSDTSFGAEAQRDLVRIAVHGRVGQPSTTTIAFGEATVTLAGSLTEAEDAVREVRAGLPDPPAVDENSVELTNDGAAVLYLFMDADDQRAELRLAKPDGEGDYRLELRPFLSAEYEDGRLVGATVTNPLAPFALGRVDPPPLPTTFTCTVAGCVGSQPSFVQVCPAGVGCSEVAVPGPVPVDSSLMPAAAQGHLLTVRAHDRVAEGVDVRLLAGEVTHLRNTVLEGDAASGSFAVRSGNRDVLRVALRTPGAADPTLGMTLTGEALEALAPEGLAVTQDLRLALTVTVLGRTVSGDQTAWGTLDVGRALVVERWTAGRSDVEAVRLSSLLTLDPLLLAYEDAAGRAHVVLGEGQARVEAANAQLSEVVRGARDPADPLGGAVLELVGGAPAALLATVDVAVAASPCGAAVEGCVAVVLQAVGTLPAPDALLATVGSHRAGLEGTVTAHVNLVSGLVATALQDAGAVPLDGALRDLEAVALGRLGQAHGDLVAETDRQGLSSSVRVALRGETLADVRGATLSLFGGGSEPRPGAPVLEVGDAQGFAVRVLGPADPDALATGSSYALRVEGSAKDAPLVLQPGLEFRRVTAAGPGSVRAFDAEGRSAFAFERRGDGSAFVSLPGLERSATLPGAAVTVRGDPVADEAFQLRFDDVAASAPDGFPREVEVRKGPLTDVTGDVAVPPGLPTFLYRFLEGPGLRLTASDGHAAVGPDAASFDASRWLSGLRDVTLRADFDSEAFEAWRLVLRHAVEAAPRDGVGESLAFGYRGAAAGRQFHEALVPSASLRHAPEGAAWWFAVEVEQVVGAVRHVTVDDNGGSYYRVLLDTRAPQAFVTAPSAVGGHVVTVAWGSAPDAGSGVATFVVETRDAAAGAAWSPWIQGRSRDEGLDAQFTGAPGSTVLFRATACDAVRNCGAPSAEARVSFQPPASAAPNTAPTLAFRGPSADEAASGVVTLSWEARDAESTPVVTVHLSPDGGATFPLVLYSGTASSFAWDTGDVPDGSAYVLKLVADDGQRQREILYGPFAVDNGQVVPRLGGEGAEDDGAGEGDAPRKRSKRSPAPLVLVPALLALGFMAARRRGPGRGRAP